MSLILTEEQKKQDMENRVKEFKDGVAKLTGFITGWASPFLL